MQIFLDGVPEGASIPDGMPAVQAGRKEISCRIRSAAPGTLSLKAADRAPEIYLAELQRTQQQHGVRRLQGDCRGVGLSDGQIRAVLNWMEKNIAKEPVDVFMALDVLEEKGGVPGHAASMPPWLEPGNSHSHSERPRLLERIQDSSTMPGPRASSRESGSPWTQR